MRHCGPVAGARDSRNLDEEPAFSQTNTTTERLARYIFERMREAIGEGRLGTAGAAIKSLRVVLHESHIAWAASEGTLRDESSGA